MSAVHERRAGIVLALRLWATDLEDSALPPFGDIDLLRQAADDLERLAQENAKLRGRARSHDDAVAAQWPLTSTLIYLWGRWRARRKAVA